MRQMVKFLGISALALAMIAVLDTGTAKAQGVSFRIGGLGIAVGNAHAGHRHHGHQHGFQSTVPSFRPTFRPAIQSPAHIHGGSHVYPSFGPTYVGRPLRYHDTTHLDYHGPKFVPHNGHIDYVPGHYHVHRTGHFD